MIATISLRTLYVRLFLAFALACLILSVVCAEDPATDSYERPARAPKAKFIRFGRAGQKFIRFGRSGGPASLNDDQLAYWLSQQD